MDGLELIKRMERLDLDEYEKSRGVVPIKFECPECGEISSRYVSILIDAESAFEQKYEKPCLKCLQKISPLKCSYCGETEPFMSHDIGKFPPICSECRKRGREKEWVEDEKLWKFLIEIYPNLNQLSFSHLKKRWLAGDKKLQTTLATFMGAPRA